MPLLPLAARHVLTSEQTFHSYYDDDSTVTIDRFRKAAL